LVVLIAVCQAIFCAGTHVWLNVATIPLLVLLAEAKPPPLLLLLLLLLLRLHVQGVPVWRCE
jgi:hypothetical protein